MSKDRKGNESQHGHSSARPVCLPVQNEEVTEHLLFSKEGWGSEPLSHRMLAASRYFDSVNTADQGKRLIPLLDKILWFARTISILECKLQEE